MSAIPHPLVVTCMMPDCDLPGAFGVDVCLLRGRIGRWYCSAHRDGGAVAPVIEPALERPRPNGGQGRLL
ncbi:hypothetical protein [Zavarzinia aquatilis]|uniref:hypothetical protein n=1 Tax=Zavarzinia aquatilis TaxID=2211142 RepID=UPI00105778D2|nr:hypothetical protein [Zavarzinia aquatilis]